MGSLAHAVFVVVDVRRCGSQIDNGGVATTGIFFKTVVVKCPAIEGVANPFVVGVAAVFAVAQSTLLQVGHLCLKRVHFGFKLRGGEGREGAHIHTRGYGTVIGSTKVPKQQRKCQTLKYQYTQIKYKSAIPSNTT